MYNLSRLAKKVNRLFVVLGSMIVAILEKTAKSIFREIKRLPAGKVFRLFLLVSFIFSTFLVRA